MLVVYFTSENAKNHMKQVSETERGGALKVFSKTDQKGYDVG